MDQLSGSFTTERNTTREYRHDNHRKDDADDHGYSERRACGLIGVDRSSFQYKRKDGSDASVRARLRELANERRRFGYRRLAIMLERDGVRMNLRKVYRLYKEERLMVRRRGGRKRVLGTRAPMAIPQGPNQRWSLDFVSDALNDGRRSRVRASATEDTSLSATPASSNRKARGR